ncbi:MAG: DUF305 domain-containing protein [Candidatus Kapaibacterium sp.]
MTAGCGKQGSEPAKTDSIVIAASVARPVDSVRPGNDAVATHTASAADTTLKMLGTVDASIADISRMMIRSLGNSDENYEYRFTQEMIPYHSGAVAMANDALAKVTRSELKSLVEKIIVTQQGEITRMMDLKKTWYAGKMLDGIGVTQGLMEKINEMNKKMLEHLGEKDAGYEKRFIDQMIIHHEGAIAMAKDALVKSHQPELKTLAEQILNEQLKEIAQMQEWRQTWYGR